MFGVEFTVLRGNMLSTIGLQWDCHPSTMDAIVCYMIGIIILQSDIMDHSLVAFIPTPTRALNKTGLRLVYICIIDLLGKVKEKRNNKWE